MIASAAAKFAVAVVVGEISGEFIASERHFSSLSAIATKQTARIATISPRTVAPDSVNVRCSQRPKGKGLSHGGMLTESGLFPAKALS